MTVDFVVFALMRSSDFVEFVVVDFDVEFSFLVLKIVELSFLRLVVVVSVSFVVGFVWFLEGVFVLLDLIVLVWFFEMLIGLINLVWFLELGFFFKGCSCSVSSSNNVLVVIFDECFRLS